MQYLIYLIQFIYENLNLLIVLKLKNISNFFLYFFFIFSTCNKIKEKNTDINTKGKENVPTKNLNSNTKPKKEKLEKIDKIFLRSQILTTIIPPKFKKTNEEYDNFFAYINSSKNNKGKNNNIKITIGTKTYFVLERIGKGAQAKVFLISDDNDNKYVLKILRKKNKAKTNELIKERDLHKYLYTNPKTKRYTVNATIVNFKDNKGIKYNLLLKEYTDGKILKKLIEENRQKELSEALKDLLYFLIVVSTTENPLVIKDLHVANIMFTKHKTYAIKIIDGELISNKKDINAFKKNVKNIQNKWWPWKKRGKFNAPIENFKSFHKKRSDLTKNIIRWLPTKSSSESETLLRAFYSSLDILSKYSLKKLKKISKEKTDQIFEAKSITKDIKNKIVK